MAGEEWHHRFQQIVDAKGFRYETVEHEEIFRFVAGKPALSTEAVVYPAQLAAEGPLSYLNLALERRTRDDDRVAQCPALVGLSEMRRWGVVPNFSDGTMQVGDGNAWKPTRFSSTRHPVISLLGNQKPKAWERAELQKLKETLIRDPYSMALVAEAFEGSTDSEAPEVGGTCRMAKQDG